MKMLLLLLSFLLVSCSNAPIHGKDVIMFGVMDKDSIGLFVKDFDKAIEGLGDQDEVRILIDSPGGNVGASLVAFEHIKAAQAKGIKVIGVCQGMCASMAAWLLEVCSERQSLGTSLIMFHHIYYANNPAYRDNVLVISQHAFLEDIGKRMGISEAQWLLAFEKLGDIWFSANDALRNHLIDKIVLVDL